MNQKKLKTRRTIPGQLGDRHDYSYDSDWEDSSQMERESLKGDKYSPKLPKAMYPYLSISSSYPNSQPRRGAGSSDESDSSSGSDSGSETDSLTPHMGEGVRGRDQRMRCNASFISTRPPLDTYQGSSDPSGLSKSKSHQPSVAEPSSYTEKEGARLPVQRSTSRDTQDSGADADFVVGSCRNEVDGGFSGMSEAISQQPWGGHGSIGGYRGVVGGGISGHPSDSQPLSGYKEKESVLSSVQQSSSCQDSRFGGKDEDSVIGGHGSYQGQVGDGLSGPSKAMLQPPAVSNDSQTGSGYKETESTRSSTQQSSGRQDSRVRGTNENVAGSQTMSGDSSRIPYTEGDRRASIIPTETIDTTPHSSGSPPIPTTSILQPQDDSPPYNTRGSGQGREGSSQPADPSCTKPCGPYSPTDTIRPPQYESRYSHPSKAQGSLGSQRPKNTWGTGSSRSSGRDPSSTPSIGATGSHLWSGQATTPQPGWAAHPPHSGSIVAQPMMVCQSSQSSQQISRHSSTGEQDKDTQSVTTTSTHPGMQRRLTNITESEVYNPSQQTLSGKTQPLENPYLLPFIKRKRKKNLSLSKPTWKP